MIWWKLDCRSRKQKRRNQPITRLGIEQCDWFILPLLLSTTKMQFSLDRKRRSYKRIQCSASDSSSVGLIFTIDRIALRFWLLFSLTPITALSLVKTSLKDNFKTQFQVHNLQQSNKISLHHEISIISMVSKIAEADKSPLNVSTNSNCL